MSFEFLWRSQFEPFKSQFTDDYTAVFNGCTKHLRSSWQQTGHPPTILTLARLSKAPIFLGEPKKNMGITIYNGDLPINNGDLPINNGDLPINNGDLYGLYGLYIYMYI